MKCRLGDLTLIVTDFAAIIMQIDAYLADNPSKANGFEEIKVQLTSLKQLQGDLITQTKSKALAGLTAL